MTEFEPADREAMPSFSFNTAPTIRFGSGAAGELAQLVSTCLGNRILLVTDASLHRLGICNAALEALSASAAEVTIFDSVEADPSVETLTAAIAAGKDAQVSAVIGLGGGSPLDVAKLAALLLGSGEEMNSVWGVGRAGGPRLPLVLMPTTSGTGSEVTPVAIMTSGGEKLAVSSPLLLPNVAILDPDLTISLPPAVTAATGVDAMVHAIEAYASANPNNNPISRMLAREALRHLGGNIETAVTDGTNRAARAAMMLGAMLAGQAFANSPVAAVHALAYPLGSLFHVPHGLANALVLPGVLDFNLPAASDCYAEIAADAFPRLARCRTAREAAAGLVGELDALRGRLGMPVRLRDVGVSKADVPRLARYAMNQTRLLVNNPRPLNEADAHSIYRSAW